MPRYGVIKGTCAACETPLQGKVVLDWPSEMVRTGYANVHADDTRTVIGHIHADGELVCASCTGSKERVYGPWMHALHEDGTFLAYNIARGAPERGNLTESFFDVCFKALAFYDGGHTKVTLFDLYKAWLLELGGEEHGDIQELGMVALVEVVIRDATGTG